MKALLSGAELESVLGIAAQVRLVEPGRTPGSEGKAKRVLDRRPR